MEWKHNDNDDPDTSPSDVDSENEAEHNQADEVDSVVDSQVIVEEME